MIISIIEVVVAGFIIWGLFNEDKFVKFEDKLFAKFKHSKKHTCQIHQFPKNPSNPTHCA